jgi:antitoxin HicB
MYRYPANLTKDEGTLLVTFRDVPEAITYGATREEALQRAQDALETALMFYIDNGKPLPKPSPARRGEEEVDVTARAAMKLALYDAYRAAGVTKSELARRMGIPKTNVDRLFSLTHSSRVDMIEAAAAALGKRLVIGMRNIAAAWAILTLFCSAVPAQETFPRPCRTIQAAAVGGVAEAGLVSKVVESGVAVFTVAGGTIRGLHDVSHFTKLNATKMALLDERLAVEVTATFLETSPDACRVRVNVSMTGSGRSGSQGSYISNGRIERIVYSAIRQSLE